MAYRKFTGAIIFMFALGVAARARAARVRVWQGTISIPTYLLGPADPNPPFPLVNHHNIYPYTSLDDLTNQREMKTYRAIYLENQYLKATILPQMDGRVYSLYDKIDKREVFYRNNVIKYGMVGLRGAWISGGIEFNFPNGHTTDTVSPVSARYRQNPDGSATVVVGDMDQVSNMHWEVALTLEPDAAYLLQHVTLFNSTFLPRLYWWWANGAVAARDDMQFIYPMRLVNPHSHTQIWTFPVWKGVNYSWYKDVRHATSLFGVDVHRSFFGVYYHQSNYGVIHVANYHEVPGKKTWTWGVAGDGLIWTHLLTDHDGPYCEIQAGHFQTQLNQEFMTPQKVESWNEYWYPVDRLGGGFVAASAQMAINVTYLPSDSIGKPIAVLRVSPAAEVPGAKVEVMMGGKTLASFAPVNFAPLATRNFVIPVGNAAAAKKGLDVSVLNSAGKTLLHWSAGAPIDGNPDLKVKAGVRRLNRKPDSELSLGALFKRGVSEEKEGRSLGAAQIYNEALKRDPNYVPALLKLATDQYMAADFAGAEQLLERVHGSGGAQGQYLSGVVYRAAGKLSLANGAFRSSIRLGGTEASALIERGEIAIEQRHFARAEKFLRAALEKNPDDGLALTDLAVALRLGGNLQEASRAAAQAARTMPILPYALAEQWQIETALGNTTAAAHGRQQFTKTVGYRSQGYLEAGEWYRDLRDFTASDVVLQAALKNLPVDEISPLVDYYLAANFWDAGEPHRAAASEADAIKANPDGIFPGRVEDAIVLREALAHNPTDAHAQYFLATFLFAHGHYEEAADLWMKAAAEGFHYAVLYRDLGVYAWKVQGNLSEAVRDYARAIAQSPNDYRLYVSLDEIYSQLGETRQREQLFAGAPPDVLGHDLVRARRLLLNVQERHYDRALDALKGHEFKPWEGGEIMHELYVLANVEKGKEAFVKKHYEAAGASFRAALEYPANLGVGEPEYPQNEQALYWLGRTLEAQGQKAAAQKTWRKAVAEMQSLANEPEGRGVRSSQFYGALALDRLGHAGEAARILDAMAGRAAKGRASAYEFYLAGLVENYRRQRTRALADFHRALELDPTLWQARIRLRE